MIEINFDYIFDRVSITCFAIVRQPEQMPSIKLMKTDDCFL